MRIWLILAGLLALSPGICEAQMGSRSSPAAAAVGAEWQAQILATQHLGEAIQKLVQEGEALRREQAEVEGRLKWVLENWVPSAVSGEKK